MDTINRIALITDNWKPQVNGIVDAVENTLLSLKEKGYETLLIELGKFPKIRIPSHLEIEFAYAGFRKLADALMSFKPHAIHTMTQGPLGWATRRFCLRRGLPFTSSVRTRFPECLSLHTGLPLTEIGYKILRRFHNRGVRTTVNSESMRELLLPYGFKNLVIWPCGVQTSLFYPRKDATLPGAQPIFMYMGRVVKEKNIEAFLDLRLPGSKYVIGDGSHLATLKKAYPTTYFTGYKRGNELATCLSAADVFVFPSRTETFGQVMIQANACGAPVAALPVIGPQDVVVDGVNGFLDSDLQGAALKCLSLNRAACINHARRFSWQACTDTFLAHLAPIGGDSW